MNDLYCVTVKEKPIAKIRWSINKYLMNNDFNGDYWTLINDFMKYCNKKRQYKKCDIESYISNNFKKFKVFFTEHKGSDK
jgi:hypothetical protein